jgi:LysM repeat protein
VRSGTPRSKTSKTSKPGRHKRPSQVQKAAQRAGLAAPALAVAGALAATPQALAAPVASHPAPSAATAHPVTARLDAAVRPAEQAARSYTVRTGDTLSEIAQRFYGHARDWHWLYRVNSSTVSNPNVIKSGQVLSVPADPPASARNATYRPRHAKTASHSSSATVASTAVPGSSAVTCTATQGTVPANYAAIVSFLTAHGYTGIAAAGIAGNIYQESMGNPESAGSGGGGLIGWTPLPSGFVTGNPSADLQTQLNALLTYNQQWSQFIPALNAATSAAQAADIFMNDFERPGIPAAGNREAAAQAVAAACGL